MQNNMQNKMHKKTNNTALTLVELIVVIVLIAILVWLGVNFLSSGNFSKQQSAGIECGMHLTKEINSFVDNARRSNKITTKIWENLTKILPNKYYIDFSQNNIQFRYTTDENTTLNSYKNNLLDNTKCKKSKYSQKLFMTGNVKTLNKIRLEMNKGFMGDKIGEISTFKILNIQITPPQIIQQSAKENSIILQSCKKNWMYCVDAYKFTINIATQKVNSQICRGYKMKDWEVTNICNKRR